MHERDVTVCFLLATVLLSVSCQRNESSARTQPPPATGHVLVTVNGVPISDEDVAFKLSLDSHNPEVTPERKKNALESLVREELVYQRAVALGLHKDPDYQNKLNKMRAQYEGLRRGQLSDVFYRHQVVDNAAASDAEARAYFAEHASHLRTQFHVWQILVKGDEPAIKKGLDDLQAGTPFEEVAARQFPTLPASGRPPWDLGHLRYTQLPEVWRDIVIALKPGQTSDIIRGPRRRFWIIKLIATREDPTVTFEHVKTAIHKELRRTRIEKLRTTTESQLRNKAKIEYSTTPPPAPAREE